MEALILKAAASGTLIFGICGGYQMLGETLSDPHHVEAGGTIKGMGLLPMDTIFAENKTRTRVSGKFLNLNGDLAALSGAELEGYEKGQVTELGAVNVRTGIYTGRSPN